MNNITVIKVGTGVISNSDKTKLDYRSITNIGKHIKKLRLEGENVVLVTSGAVAAGIQRAGWTRAFVDNDLELKRVASMIGNSELFRAWENATGMIAAPDLPTHNDLDSKESWDHLAAALKRSLELGFLPILNEGDARSSEELVTKIKASGREIETFGDNDWLAAHAAVQLHAARLEILTATNGVLTDISDKSSTIRNLSINTLDKMVKEGLDDSKASNGGMLSKLLAARFAITYGVQKVSIRNGTLEGESTSVV